MIKIFAYDLIKNSNKYFNKLYIIYGENEFLLQESKKYIIKLAQKKKFKIKLDFLINLKTNWEDIFFSLKEQNLFYTNKIIILKFKNKIYNYVIEKKLIELVTMIKKNLLIIFEINIFNTSIFNSLWLKTIYKNIIFVNCSILDKNNKFKLLKLFIKKKKILINYNAVNYLYNYYDGNLLLINKSLERIKIIFNKKLINLKNISYSFDNIYEFNLYNLIYSIMYGNISNANKILNKFKYNSIKPILIIRIIQNNIIKIINMKKKLNIISLNIIFKINNLYNNNIKNIYKKIIFNFSIFDLYKILTLICKIEFLIKTDYKYKAWNDILNIIYIFSKIKIPFCFLN
ncbi:MAG: DNA polymerase III subunit delta [Candidatus Makana argininalis]